ncbi:MAG: hypothetical protein CMM41_05470 [Rhodospirillaceae bacterium]|nr:hypothetical protein [Rhodospirillaceae bacterium]|tara:strand:+ start:283 stop:1044 length:762 start_codon:yes stop_codon:yes gene_type:complete
MINSEKHGSVLILTINRPYAGNSINAETARELEIAVGAAAKDNDLRAVIITGYGQKYFCAGGDIKEYRDVTNRNDLDKVMGHVRRALINLETLNIPTIAAINGFCLGGGLELTLAADIRISSSKAKFALPQSRLGIIPGWHGIERLVRLIGRGRTTMLAAGGQLFDAYEAERLGLVDEIVTDQLVLERAEQIASEFDHAAPLALHGIKKVVRQVANTPESSSEEVFADLWFSEDHREAEDAFAEKRSAIFKGR